MTGANNAVEGFSSTAEKVMLVGPTGPNGGQYLEGALGTLSGSVTTSTIVLSKGPEDNQIIDTVQVAAPGVVGTDMTIQFFDGNPNNGNAITGVLYLNAQPAGGFKVPPYHILETGELGWVLSNRTSGNTKVYFGIVYGY